MSHLNLTNDELMARYTEALLRGVDAPQMREEILGRMHQPIRTATFNGRPSKCWCAPGHCGAPRIMGRQMKCLDLEKADYRNSALVKEWKNE